MRVERRAEIWERGWVTRGRSRVHFQARSWTRGLKGPSYRPHESPAWTKVWPVAGRPPGGRDDRCRCRSPGAPGTWLRDLHFILQELGPYRGM